MQSEARVGAMSEVGGGTVVGTFQNVVDAERALGALREIGVPSERVSMVMGEAREEQSAPATERASGTNVAGGAATGATLGGVVGILWGWISGSSVLAVPGTVASVSSGILTSTLAGLAIGAAVGGLIGALVGVGMPEIETPEAESDLRSPERRIVVTVQATWAEAEQARETLRAHGAALQGDTALQREHILTRVTQPTLSDITTLQEDIIMGDEGAGHNANALTGTQDAIDPETGTLGTAGTPVTAGYGVSGSTIGTGSSAGRTEQESGDFSGSMPDTHAYDGGGRGSDDSPERVTEHDTPVEEKHVEVGADEAAVPSEPETRDVYEAGQSYSAPTGSALAEAADADATDVDTPPTYGKVETESTQESAGTNIPGTADPRGLGDNTDG